MQSPSTTSAFPHPNPAQRLLALHLIRVRERAGLSRAQLAERTDFSLHEIENIESGYSALDAVALRLWCRAVGTSLPEFARELDAALAAQEDRQEKARVAEREAQSKTPNYSHDCEAILVPGEGRIGSIFHYINGRFDVHQRVYAITQFQPSISPRFVHLYLSKFFGVWAMQNTVKATVDSLRLPTFQTFEMTIPQTSDEQIAIAEVLSDMDAELAALMERRAKTRDLKQGMMQELLTGATRLL